MLFIVAYYIIITPYFPGRPQMWRSAYYVNLLEEATSDVLVTVHCGTYDFPPTYVVWKRNGAAISVDGENYEALQIVTNWYHSQYSNTLIIRDVAGILEQPVYTCIVGNVEGNVSSSVEVDISLKFALSGMHVLYRLLYCSVCIYT